MSITSVEKLELEKLREDNAAMKLMLHKIINVYPKTYPTNKLVAVRMPFTFIGEIREVLK